METCKYCLVVGGSGVLGSSIVKVFKNNNSSWKICCIDTRENKEADMNIVINLENKINEEIMLNVYKQVESLTNKFGAIINVSEDWVKGSIKSIEIFSQSNEMLNKNYYLSLLGKNNIYYLVQLRTWLLNICLLEEF